MHVHDIPVRHDPRDAGRKMSECLGELIDPYVQDHMPAKHFRVLVAVGALAWNLSVAPSEDPDRELHELLADLELEPADQRLFTGLVGELQRRKVHLFPDDDRIIANWDIREQGPSRYFLTVAALTSAAEGRRLTNRGFLSRARTPAGS